MIHNNESNKWIVSNDSNSKPQQLISHVLTNNNQPKLMLNEPSLSTLKRMIVKFTSNYKGCTVASIGKQKTHKSTTTNHAFATNFQVGNNSLIQTTQGVFYEHRVITNSTNNDKLNLVLFDFEGFDASNVENSEIRNALSMRYMQFAHAFSNLIVFSLGQYASVIDEFITTLEMKGELFSNHLTKPHLLILQHCADALSENELKQVKKQTLTNGRESRLQPYFSDITYIVCFKDPNQNKVSLRSLTQLRNEICNICCSNYHDNIKVMFDLQEVLNWKDIIGKINNNKSIEAAVDTCGRVSEQKCQKGYKYAIKEWDKNIQTHITSNGCSVLNRKEKIIKEVKNIYMESGAFGAHYEKYLLKLDSYFTKDYKYFIKCSGRCGHCNNKSCTMYESHSEDGRPKCDCNECCLEDKVPKDNNLYKNNHCQLPRGHKGPCCSKDCSHSCSGCSSSCNSKEPNHGSGNVPHSCMKNVSVNCSICGKQFNTKCGYPKVCGELKKMCCINSCGDYKLLKCGETYYCDRTVTKSCSAGCGFSGSVKCGASFYCGRIISKFCSAGCGSYGSVKCGASFYCGKTISKLCSKGCGSYGSVKCGETYDCGRTVRKYCLGGCGSVKNVKCYETSYYCNNYLNKKCDKCKYSATVKCGDSFVCKCCYGSCFKCGKSCSKQAGHLGSHKCNNYCTGKCVSCGESCNKGCGHDGDCVFPCVFPCWRLFTKHRF